MNIGDRVEYYDPLLNERITGTVYYKQKATEHNGWNTYVRGDVQGGVTALHDGMNVRIVEPVVYGSFRDRVKSAMLLIKESL